MTTVTVNETTNTVVVTTPGPAGPSRAAASMARGQCSKQLTARSTSLPRAATSVPGLVATLDTDTAHGMVLGTDDTFGLKNDSASTKLFRIYGSIDANTVTQNNKVLGIKLAKNGTAIDETECRAYTGGSNEEAKLVTSWMVELDDGDEISLMIANHSSTTDIILKRGRIIAVEVFA